MRAGILVIEDDDSVNRLLDTLLRGAGYVVHLTTSGEQGIDLFRQHHQSIGLVLLNIGLPGMDGVATFAELRKVDPAVQVCFTSGDTGRYTVEELLALGALHFLSKPFRLAELLPLVSRLLSPDKHDPSQSGPDASGSPPS